MVKKLTEKVKNDKTGGLLSLHLSLNDIICHRFYIVNISVTL